MAAVLKTMSVGTVSIWHSLAMVLPMITGTHPVSARTHSGKYPLMENRLLLLSINGRYAGSDLVCRIGSQCAAGAWLATAWAAIAFETLVGDAAFATCRCNWPTVSTLFARIAVDTPCGRTGGAPREPTGLLTFIVSR